MNLEEFEELVKRDLPDYAKLVEASRLLVPRLVDAVKLMRRCVAVLDDGPAILAGSGLHALMQHTAIDAVEAVEQAWPK